VLRSNAIKFCELRELVYRFESPIAKVDPIEVTMESLFLLLSALEFHSRVLDVGIKRKLAKSCSRQNSFCRNPLNSNSIVSRWISSRLHRLRPETSWLSLIPTSQH
jgi:hypothetical protein